LWQNTSNSLSGATQVGGTVSGISNSSNAVFNTASGAFSSIGPGITDYFLITVDVAANPGASQTVKINSTALSNFTFTTSPTVTGTDPATAGNTFTINAQYTSARLAVPVIGDGTSLSSGVAAPVQIFQFNTSGTSQSGSTIVSFPSGATSPRLTQ